MRENENIHQALNIVEFNAATAITRNRSRSGVVQGAAHLGYPRRKE